MEDKSTPKKSSVFTLIIGIAFVGYGSYRLFTFLQGAETTTFRIIIAVGFVLIGAFDLYKYFRKRKPQEEI